MSQARGKVTRDRKRRISDPLPYKIPAKTPTGMPTTRHSPARGGIPPAPTVDPPIMGDVLRELAALRQSIDSKFEESGKKVDNVKAEVLAKLDANDQAIAELQVTVTDVTLSVDRNQRAIQEVRAEVERREVELPQRVKTIVQEALAARPPRQNFGQKPRSLPAHVEASSPPSSQVGSIDNNAAAYAKARRSLRLWPVSKEGSLRDRTVEFMVNELLLDQEHAADIAFEVKRIGGRAREGGLGGVKDEVLVVFDNLRDRDEVRSHAKNLERRGRGLRLEIPDHLWPSFRALQSVGYELKQRNSSLKRNVLFDDERADLKLDVCLRNDEWKTIRPDEARASLKKMGKASSSGTAVTTDELDSMLAVDESVIMENDEEY